MRFSSVVRGLVACVFVVLSAACFAADDWPMWRHDAQRTGATSLTLPAQLHLLWTRELPPLAPAWPDQQDRMPFDAGYEPIVAGNLLYVGSSRDDAVTAYDTATGAEKWRFQADGPIRLAPVFSSGLLFFACDDGCLYALDAVSGSLRWRHRGFPSERKVLGNTRLISPWPARGGPVVADGKVYFAAGIWPFMGVSVQALDAATGQVLWLNDKQGSTFMLQPHNSPAFAGIAPQGYLAVCGDRLLVPGGRSVPAGFDRASGEMLYYKLAEFGKSGNAYVQTMGNCFFNAGYAFAARDGERIDKVGLGKDLPVIEPRAVYFIDRDKLTALRIEPDGLKESEKKILDAKPGAKQTMHVLRMSMSERWSVDGKNQTLHLKAGHRLYLGAKDQILTLDIPDAEDGKPAPSWKAGIKGMPFSMVVADQKLFVVTLEGGLYCFGGKQIEPVRHAAVVPPVAASDGWEAKARAILERTGTRAGYAVCFGLSNGRLLEELARQSSLQLIALDADGKKVDTVRRYLAGKGLYGSRIAVHVESAGLELPSYLASLVVSEDLEAGGVAGGKRFAQRVFNVLRPYGGLACLESSGKAKDALAQAVNEAQLTGAQLQTDGEFMLLKRPGALPGSADWTHQHADAAKSCVSRDSMVRAPLGVLWFGGPSHVGVLPRHGHGPAEQIVGGRLFIQGPDLLRALDVYTGRLLWEAELKGVGTFFDNTSHQPGANSLGGNFVSTETQVYVIHGRGLQCFDAATGDRSGEFSVSVAPGEKEPPEWGTLALSGDFIVACVRPMIFESSRGKPGLGESWDRTSSKTLAVLNRKTGALVWSRDAALGFIHNAVAVGSDRIFCIDALAPGVVAAMKKRNKEPQGAPKLLCLDLSKGTVLWSQEADVFGTWLGYSTDHDVLIQSGRRSRDVLPDEPDKRVIAYGGKEGKRLWDKPIETGGPPMLRDRLLITQQSAYDLLTGEQHQRRNSLTGTSAPFAFSRNYGCNAMIGSTHLLTFRSAAAGYFDLANDGGTGNFGGFKSGCTSNLIAANGVLNAPDYTRTCVCSYQNQTSLAMVHTPDVEMWTFSDIRPGSGPVVAAGVNFGAPGDRRADNGTLWLDYPKVGGPSPDLDVTVEPAKIDWFRKHSTRLSGEGLKWVAASGGQGLTMVQVRLVPKADAGKVRAYTVRLVFSEPETVRPGERVFDVSLQGQQVLKALDIVQEAGGADRVLMKEFRGVKVKDTLNVGLTPTAAAREKAAIISGIEVLAE